MVGACRYDSTLPSSAQASLLHVFEKACQRSNPQKHTAKYLHRENAGFRVGDRVYPENTKISFIACGKAAAAQAKAVIAWAGNQLQNGLVIPPAPVEWNWPPEVAVHVASHPTPSDRSESAAAKAFELSEAVGPEGLLLACISGGASALLAAPRPPLNLNEQVLITKELLKSGVDIRIMNILRQQFSLIKGGGLAGGVSGRVETLIYSDIETESLDLIGSGPTLPMQRNQGEIIAQWESTQPLLNLPPKLQLKCDQLVRSEKNAPKNNQTNDAILCASPQTLKAIACAIAEESGFVIAPTQNASYGTSMDEVVQTIVETANALKRDSIKQATPMLAIWVRSDPRSKRSMSLWRGIGAIGPSAKKLNVVVAWDWCDLAFT